MVQVRPLLSLLGLGKYQWTLESWTRPLLSSKGSNLDTDLEEFQSFCGEAEDALEHEGSRFTSFLDLLQDVIVCRL